MNNYYEVFLNGEEIDAGYADKYTVSSSGILTLTRYTPGGASFIQYFEGEWDRFTENGEEPHNRGTE